MSTKKTPSEIMDLIDNLKDRLHEERKHTLMDSPERDKIDHCLDHCDKVYNAAIEQDLASRTERVTKLKDALSGATTELKELKTSIEGLVAVLNTAQAFVNTARSLLPFL